ncbi:MAG: hypothetical protein AAFO06_16350 [Cyanobacteria bacterium J06597_16]
MSPSWVSLSIEVGSHQYDLSLVTEEKVLNVFYFVNKYEAF